MILDTDDNKSISFFPLNPRESFRKPEFAKLNPHEIEFFDLAKLNPRENLSD